MDTRCLVPGTWRSARYEGEVCRRRRRRRAARRSEPAGSVLHRWRCVQVLNNHRAHGDLLPGSDQGRRQLLTDVRRPPDNRPRSIALACQQQLLRPLRSRDSLSPTCLRRRARMLVPQGRRVHRAAKTSVEGTSFAFPFITLFLHIGRGLRSSRPRHMDGQHLTRATRM